MTESSIWQERWRRSGKLCVRRGARFALCAGPVEPMPDWASVMLPLDRHHLLLVEAFEDLCIPGQAQEDGVWFVAKSEHAIEVRRDGLGRSLVFGVTMPRGVWLSSEPDLPGKEHESSPCQGRLIAHQQGWDRHDIGEQDFLEGVWRLLPGHACVFERGVRVGGQRSWWAEEVRQEHDRFGHVASVEQLCELLDDALYEHRTQDTGFAVSSGLDSTLLAARARVRDGEQWTQRLGSMSFPGLPSCDETMRVQQWAGVMGARNLTFVDMTHTSPWFENPHEFAAWGPQSHPGEGHEQVFVRRFACANSLTSVITGVGADQLFEVDSHHVLEAMWRQGHVDKLARAPWRTMMGRAGMLGLAAKSWGRSLWRNVTPEHVQVDRIVQQLCAAHLASDDVSSVARGIATSMVQRDTTWGETPEQEMRRQVMKSWEWEALMRALFRLERASGVTIHTPYLSERLWRWGVWLDALDRLDSVKGRLYNKFLLRCAHGAHAHLFPEGFARRGKAAVFDAHLGRGMMGTEHLWIEEVLQAMERGPRQKIALQQWEQVRAGTLGRPLVELCRTLMTERWRLALVDSTGNRT